MKRIAGCLMIVCLVIGGCLRLPLSAKGEENSLANSVARREWHDPVSGIDFIWVPEGCFQMGCMSGIDCQGKAKPVHRVCLNGFWMGKYEVTQEQWQQVMGNNPSKFPGDARPVEQVSWHDVQEFLQTLNDRVGKQVYRLPSEAEWEYAARAGTQTAYSFGNDAYRLNEYAWYSSNSGFGTHPVGQLKPNAWGLYDMHGNVGEWCQDWFARDYYTNSPEDNPQGSVSGLSRVWRGGSWFGQVGCRASHRSNSEPDNRLVNVGFRIVKTP